MKYMNGIKKYFLLIVILFLSFFNNIVTAQRYAVIDMKYILEKIPEYTQVDARLQQLGKQWQREIDQRQADADLLRKNYEAEQYMLTDELKKKRETEIYNKDKEVRDLQKRYFGYEGELFKERQKMVQPIQAKIYNAVHQMAVTRGYDFILDKSEGITVIFADPKLNRSDDVLRTLGIKLN